MSSSVPLLTLNDSNKIPQLGLGVWQANIEQTTIAVREALLAGYRHIDTASIYGNESGVGAGLKASRVPREDVFITTKVWNDAHGGELAHHALHKSLKQLGLDYVDLLLIHWPVPHHDRFIETWYSLIALREKGLVRSIGVSNFTDLHLNRLIHETGVHPVLNQIELHPYLQQQDLRKTHSNLGILTESWSPLAQNQALNDSTISLIAAKHGKTTAQVIIRWHLDNNLIVIPKSITPTRIRENIDVFNFRLDPEDMAFISALDRNQRLGPDPDTFG